MQVTIIYYFATEVGCNVKSHVNLNMSKDCIMDDVINRYTWHKYICNMWIFAKALAIKPYILNVIRHKTS